VEGLVRGGYFLLIAYTPEQLKFKTGGPSSAEYLPTLADLRADVRGLAEVEAQEVEREIYEGDGHGGRSAVVEYVGRR
jgi:hypothetical protein